MARQNTTKIFKAEVGAHAPDRYLIITIFVIVLFGLISLSSASSVISYTKTGNPYSILSHQLLAVIIGFASFYFFANINYHIWRKYAFGFLIFSVFLLLLVFIPGISGDWGQARSWINIFGIYSLQPSEFVKISFLLYLAAWLEARRGELKNVQEGIGPFLGVLGLICFLIILQPDFGTLSIISAVSLIVYFVGGGSLKHIIMIILAGVIALFLLIQIKPYIQQRFQCLLDPQFDARGTCYQVNQSLIAVGSGGFFGRGLGDSRQKFFYVPEVQGDSIFSIIAEEMGFIISILLVFAYLFIFYRGYLIARNSPDDFARILAIGIASWVLIQALTNIGGIINIMPMTGVPLPLISYGGSSIMATMTALGILSNISRYVKTRA